MASTRWLAPLIFALIAATISSLPSPAAIRMFLPDVTPVKPSGKFSLELTPEPENSTGDIPRASEPEKKSVLILGGTNILCRAFEGVFFSVLPGYGVANFVFFFPSSFFFVAPSKNQ